MKQNQQFVQALSYDDVLLVPKYSDIATRSQIDLTTKISKNLTLEIPLIATKMDTITGVEMAIAMGKLGGLAILPRFETIETQADKAAKVKKSGVIVAAAIGVKDDFMNQVRNARFAHIMKRAEALFKAGVTVIDIDVAHGHMKKTIDVTKAIKNRFKNKVTLISGIAATYECADDLYMAGADSILVGIGAGSICTTRIMTGCGVPGFDSLLRVAKAAKKHKKTFMPDAGIKNSGDIVKALATGASAIVAGSIFAGTDECPGEIVEINGKVYKKYNGSASFEEKNNQVTKDSSDKSKTYTIHIEGVESLVNYKGSVSSVVDHLLAGVKSGLSYVGAKNIPELWKKAEFITITSAGVRENNAHDVLLLKG